MLGCCTAEAELSGKNGLIEQPKLLYIIDGSVKWYNYYGKWFDSFL